jgi:RimJ/RimL family protein N-acetyltransferase
MDEDLSRFLHPVTGRLEDQEAWMRAYEEREGDWYWLVERRSGGQLEGTIALYGLEENPRHAEWGRWILRKGSPAALESAWLLYRAAFEKLGMDYVYCRTLAVNEQVLSFHDSCGLTRAALIPAAFTLRGKVMGAVEHRLEAEQWSHISQLLAPKVERLARMLTGAGGA